LAFLINLIGQENLVIFIEHPEQHLHPHGMRFLFSIIQSASTRNQIVITTHDPHFVSSETIEGLPRAWWVGSGSQIRGANRGDLTTKQLAQIQTVFRILGNREAVFARSVILVENESQQLCVLGVAATLGFQLDANGVSVIPVGGETGYPPFFTLLDTLAVPYVCLKDKSWDRRTYPADRFFSFGCELEDYLDKQALSREREAVVMEVGTSKPRVAAELARRLKAVQVPNLFSELLQAALDLATSEPADARPL